MINGFMENCGCKIIEKYEWIGLKVLILVRCKLVLVTQKYIKLHKNLPIFNKNCSEKCRQKNLVRVDFEVIKL